MSISCYICGGPLGPNNRSGVCWRNPDCRRESWRCWAKANPEKARENRHRWNATHLEKVRENKRRWRAAHPEKRRKANREKDRENNRRWRKANRQSARRYHAANREKSREKCRRRRARKLAVTILPFTAQELASRMEVVFDNRCLWCGGPYEHVDHFVPLTRGGAHDLINLVPACARCNTSKGNLMPGDYLARLLA